jgi:hypothetical protein
MRVRRSAQKTSFEPRPVLATDTLEAVALHFIASCCESLNFLQIEKMAANRKDKTAKLPVPVAHMANHCPG